jgi:manganese-dependent ADP-ribose/CDP-alcohol diphosphatase
MTLDSCNVLMLVQGSAQEICLALGSNEIETTLNASRCVCAVFSGHDHRGGYAVVDGVHYIVLEAVVESPDDSNAYCTVDVYGDHFLVNGSGTVTSRTCKLR